MKKNYLTYLTLFIILGIVFIILFSNVIISDQKILDNYEKINNKKININSYILKQVSGDSMSPLIKNGEKLKYQSGYYEKAEIKTGDIVNYNFAGKEEYIKQVKATTSDKLEIKGSNLYINGKLMKNSIGEVYNFSEAEINLLKLYIGKDGKLPKKSVFIFGDNVKTSKDSRKFGAVSKIDLLGKFEL